MRLTIRNRLSSFARSATLCAVAALVGLPAGAGAQTFAPPGAANLPAIFNANAFAVLAVFDGSTAFVSGVTTTDVTASDVTSTQASYELGSPLAGIGLSIPVETTGANDPALDDQMLSRQRGGAVGMLMVAATPQLMRGNGSGSGSGGNGNSVTLWDEIAPPAPLPIPVDAARAAQGNVANYQRK